MIVHILPFIGFFLILIGYALNDIRHLKLSNGAIIVLFVLGAVYQLLMNNLFSIVPLLAVTGVVGYILWYFNSCGGADAKLFMILPLLLPGRGLPEILHFGVFFFFCLGITSMILGFILVGFKHKKSVPFIPIIALCYGLTLAAYINYLL